MTILELMAEHPGDRFTLSEVARHCGFNKATTHAILSALSERGILLRHPDEKRYSLGPRLVAIGEAARQGYRSSDFAPRVLDRLVTETGHWARAFERRDDQVLAFAQVGGPPEADAQPSIPVPLVAPVGAVWMAWADSPSVQAWLARAVSADAVRTSLDSLPVIRQQGCAITVASAEWVRLCEPAWPPLPGAGRLEAEEVRSLLGAVGRQELNLPRSAIEDDARYRVAEVAAPVFGMDAGVELVVALSGLGGRDRVGAEIQVLTEHVVGAARSLTEAVGGRVPVGESH